MKKDLQFYKFSLYGFLKNLKFFEIFIILFFREKGLSFFQIGFLFSISSLLTNVFEVPTGLFSRFLGQKKIHDALFSKLYNFFYNFFLI